MLLLIQKSRLQSYDEQVISSGNEGLNLLIYFIFLRYVLHSQVSQFALESVRGLLDQWPSGFKSNTPKEVLFLHELELILEILTPSEFEILLLPVMVIPIPYKKAAFLS
jgi:hypothetical protein